jgi:hypothetical protein
MATKILEQASLTTRVELGDIVRDSITGFEGSVESITVWRFGCRRTQVRPTKLSKDGLPIETQVFDEPSLHIIKRANVPEAVQDSRRKNGGPKDARSERLAISRN